MEGMKVEVVSRETIKPSSPTPHHLRDLKLSFLDQISPPIYIPIITFYRLDLNLHLSDRCSRLKKSLAAILTQFYPLAGRLGENSSVDCNDEGAEYVEARVTSCKFSEVIEQADMKLLNQLLPFEPYSNGTNKQVLLGAQFNVFECGGVAIGLCVSHTLADGTSASTFLNAWAATSRDVTSEALHPVFDAASHFPPRDISGYSPSSGITTEKIVTRRFVFEKSSIIDLKQQAASNSTFDFQEKLPTRVEAISALIWKRFMAIARSNLTPAKVFLAVHAVNLRARTVPPLPIHSFANLWCVAQAVRSVELEEDYPSLVLQLRNSINEVNYDYAKMLHENSSSYIEVMKNNVEQLSKGEIELCSFTSWCRFPLYEVDFGWGTPAWVCSPMMLYKNTAMLMSTKDGNGIEAFVNLVEEDVDLFENDPEFLSFVSSSKNSG